MVFIGEKSIYVKLQSGRSYVHRETPDANNQFNPATQNCLKRIKIKMLAYLNGDVVPVSNFDEIGKSSFSMGGRLKQIRAFIS